MTELPEPIQFCLDTCSRLARAAIENGDDVLSPLERTIYRVYVFDCEEQNGSLSQFFYNTDYSVAVSSETADSLDQVGAVEAAGTLRKAAAIFCRPDLAAYVGTIGSYEALVDPTGQLDRLIRELHLAPEDVADLLQQFVLSNRSALPAV